MLELVDRFRLGRNGFITVQVQILLPIHRGTGGGNNGPNNDFPVVVAGHNSTHSDGTSESDSESLYDMVQESLDRKYVGKVNFFTSKNFLNKDEGLPYDTYHIIPGYKVKINQEGFKRSYDTRGWYGPKFGNGKYYHPGKIGRKYWIRHNGKANLSKTILGSSLKRNLPFNVRHEIRDYVFGQWSRK